MDCCCPPTKQLTLKICTPELRCGCHVPYKGNLFNTVKSAGCKCVQMYLPGQGVDHLMIKPEDKQRTNDYCRTNNISMYVHCPFNANLAKKNCRDSIDIVSSQLDIVKGLPAACVLHVGKVGTLENVAQRINEIQTNGHLGVSESKTVPYQLLLEVAAGQGTELGTTTEELRKLYEGIDKSRVGFCMDTQHAFAAGMCKFDTHENVVKLFDSIDAIVPNGISLIHLNDSEKSFASRVDRHAPLREGYIWSVSENLPGLQSLLTISRDRAIDIVSETSNPYSDIVTVNSLLQS